MAGAAPRAAPALAAAAEGCAPRGKLDPIYCDDNGDGIADPPKDPSKLLPLVDFDMALLVIAGGLYRLLARTMRGYADAQARQIFRDLIDMPARRSLRAVRRGLRG